MIEYFVYGAWVMLIIHSYLLYKLIKAVNLKVNSGDIIAILQIITQVLGLIKTNPSAKDIEAVEKLLELLMNKYNQNVK